MKKFLYISVLLLGYLHGITQNQAEPDFQWGNASYFNFKIGETIHFQETDIELLKIKNHFNQFRIGKDTFWIKISRRTLPKLNNGLRIFVADNKNVKALASNSDVHSLLQEDALVCISSFNDPLLDPNTFLFPISYNDGFLWSTEEDTHIFSYEKCENNKFCSHGGIDIDLHDARGIEKHWILALENSTVIWINDKKSGDYGKEACVLLQSESNPEIFYLYEHLYNRKVEVKEKDKLVRGEPIGTIWGDEKWGHLCLTVLKSDTIPSFQDRCKNVVNFFPQLYELYFKQTFNYNKAFSKGIIRFAQPCNLYGNKKNLVAFEEYSGKGWQLGNWNPTDRVEGVTRSEGGNARLRKQPFSGSNLNCKNVNNYFDYELIVYNGVYRIRAKVGDLELASWQKVQFEGIDAADYTLKQGEQKWTSEKVVKVKDSRLTIRIYVDETNKKVAGLSEIVFQRAY